MIGWKGWQALCDPGQNWGIGAEGCMSGRNVWERGIIQKAHKQYDALCFYACQVGWFPSTYVEEEDWVCWLNDVHSASSRSWPPPVSAMLLCHSLCRMSLIKSRDSSLRGRRSALKNLLLSSDRLSHRADVKSQIPGASRHIFPLCGPVCPRGPLGSVCAVPR